MIQAFPRRYELATFEKVSCVVAGLVALVVGVGVLLVALSSRSGRIQQEPVLFLFFLGAVLASSYLFLRVRRYRVLLTADGIEVHRVFTTKALATKEIAGYREGPRFFGSRQFEFYRHANADFCLRFSIVPDEAFDERLRTLTQLDQAEEKASLEAYISDESQPGSTSERLESLKSARVLARSLTFLAIAVGLWFGFHPPSFVFSWIMLACIPWLALFVAASNPVKYSLSTLPNDVRADLTMGWMLPCMIMTILASGEWTRLDVLRLALVSAPVALLCLALWLWFGTEVRRRGRILVLVSVMLSLYGGANVLFANRVFDSSPGESGRARMLAIKPDTKSRERYYVTLEVWDDLRPATIRIPKQDVDPRIHFGDLCVQRWQGALGIRRFELRPCAGD